MLAGDETRLWHPFADMGAVRHREFVIDRGEDVWVWDIEGRRYLDATASLWYANVGHGRPRSPRRWRGRWRDRDLLGVRRLRQRSRRGSSLTQLAELAPMRARVFLGSGGGDAVEPPPSWPAATGSRSGSPSGQLLISRTAGYHGTHGYGTALAGIPPTESASGQQVTHRPGPPRLGRGARGRSRRRAPSTWPPSSSSR